MFLVGYTVYTFLPFIPSIKWRPSHYSQEDTMNVINRYLIDDATDGVVWSTDVLLTPNTGYIECNKKLQVAHSGTL